MTSLHPMLSVGTQLTEHVRSHLGLGRRDATARALELLREVRIPDPEGAVHAFPHQFSGGMRQRIAIAVALACRPTPARRGRADHRARRHRAGRDHPPARPAPARVRPRDRPHLARSRRPLRDRRPRRGLLRGPDRRGEAAAPTCSPGRGTRTRAGCSTRCRIRSGPQPRSSRSGARRPRPGGFRPAAPSTPAAGTRSRRAAELVPPLAPVNGRTLACPVDPFRP